MNKSSLHVHDYTTEVSEMVLWKFSKFDLTETHSGVSDCVSYDCLIIFQFTQIIRVTREKQYSSEIGMCKM